MKLAITALPLFATLFLASVAEAQTLTRDGSALYVSYCASCHGMTGKGDGSAARTHWTRDMPVWGPFFSREENDQGVGPVRVDNLARYLRQLQTK